MPSTGNTPYIGCQKEKHHYCCLQFAVWFHVVINYKSSFVSVLYVHKMLTWLVFQLVKSGWPIYCSGVWFLQCSVLRHPALYSCALNGPICFCWRRCCRATWSGNALRRCVATRRRASTLKTKPRRSDSCWLVAIFFSLKIGNSFFCFFLYRTYSGPFILVSKLLCPSHQINSIKLHNNTYQTGQTGTSASPTLAYTEPTALTKLAASTAPAWHHTMGRCASLGVETWWNRLTPRQQSCQVGQQRNLREQKQNVHVSYTLSCWQNVQPKGRQHATSCAQYPTTPTPAPACRDSNYRVTRGAVFPKVCHF